VKDRWLSCPELLGEEKGGETENLVAREEGYVVAAGSPKGGRGGNRETL